MKSIMESNLQDLDSDRARDDSDFIQTEAGKNVLIALTVLSILCLMLGLYNTALMFLKWRMKFEVIALQAKAEQVQ